MDRIIYKIVLLMIILCVGLNAQSYKIIQKSDNYYKIKINFNYSKSIIDTLIDGVTYQTFADDGALMNDIGEPSLPTFSLKFAINENERIDYKIINSTTNSYENKFILPVIGIDEQGNKLDEIVFNDKIYSKNDFFPSSKVNIPNTFTFRFSTIQPIIINPVQFNPITRVLVFTESVTIEVKIKTNKLAKQTTKLVNDKLTLDYLKSSVINSDKKITRTSTTKSKMLIENNYWYNHSKTYFKIYVNSKDLYRITTNDLLQAGANNFLNSSIDNIQMFNNGIQIPIDIHDSDSLWNEGDYIQFVGYPPSPSTNVKQNIYNNENVYWLTFEGDNTQSLRYKKKSAFPHNYDKTYQETKKTIHYELDSLYERLGYAPDDKRDFWYWGRVSGSSQNPGNDFIARFDALPQLSPNNNEVTLRANFHGLTKWNCSEDHHAVMEITNQYIGDLRWDNQNSANFSSTFNIADNEIKIFPEGNEFKVSADGDICFDNTADNFLVNWFEFEYWRDNRVSGNSFFFTSNNKDSGNIRYWLWQWTGQDAQVYVPQKQKLLSDIQILDDADKTILFADDVENQTIDYFVVSSDYFKVPYRIEKNVNSNLRNTSNGADYIIITHKNFLKPAEELKNFREKNLEGFPTPRVKIVTVDEIYNEFSYGLLNPFALQDFAKYAFDNWSGTPVSYIALLGDMSYDYRGLLKSSRPNFVPSIPYHSWVFGLAASDNLIACVSGDDPVPDISIGRISCETVDEANILIDKIKSYPNDQGKLWKQNTLIISAGESKEDESYFGFNDDSMDLVNNYITPNGYSSDKVFLYLSNPDYQSFQGGTNEIRDNINKGAALVNFYGHGGGYQWDQVFLTDDVYLLENEERLPLILSVSCYTAHFANQNVFGEVFNKLENNGSIGFWGNTGLTFYSQGTSLNKKVFEEIFTNKNMIIGNIFLNAKANYASANPNKLQQDHLALLTYLGDPAIKLALPQNPEFNLNSYAISISPMNPVVGDTVSVKILINNYGSSFPNDSVNVKVLAENSDSSKIIFNSFLKSFGEKDSIKIKYIPTMDGNLKISAIVNEEGLLEESDLTDNYSEQNFSVFDLTQPSIIKPIDGFSTNNMTIDFRLADIGTYIGKKLKYFIEVDTSLGFKEPIFSSGPIEAHSGLLESSIKFQDKGGYFWRVRLFDGEKYSFWTDVRNFTVGKNNSTLGFLSEKNHLQLEHFNNFKYSDSSLVLNAEIQPPKPMDERKKISFNVFTDNLTTITTDGKFIYSAQMAYYNSWNDSKIYKIGTGNLGTIEGQNYGEIPGVSVQVRSQIFYYDGFIYVANGKAKILDKIDPITGVSETVALPDGLLNDSDGKVRDGFFYLTSDGNMVYNIAFTDSLGSGKFEIRILNPANNWKKVKDVKTASSSFQSFSGAFVVDGNLYVAENFLANYMRRIRIDDGFLFEEWVTGKDFPGYYSWCYDKENDEIYASVYYDGKTSRIVKFNGYYKNSKGAISSRIIGPANKWNSFSFNYDKNFAGKIYPYLLGKNKNTSNWDTLKSNFIDSINLSNVEAEKYPYIKFKINFTDSTNSISTPARFLGMNAQYLPPAELIVDSSNIVFSADSLLQGFAQAINVSVRNKGYAKSDSCEISLFIDNSNEPIISKRISVSSDSTYVQSLEIKTDKLAPHSSHILKARLRQTNDLFDFNNSAESSFYVKRDSIRPEYKITFDGNEILNGDVISAQPEIVFEMSDNSPLPIDTTNFNIYHNNQYISFKNDSLLYSYNSYPNSKGTVVWHPNLEDGEHLLEFIGWDASNNWIDSVSYRISFNVDRENKITEIYNYPNPFENDTYFVFNLFGTEMPDELKIRLFTISGRLIRNIEIPVNDLKFGFNKFYWDGRDEDGDEIANGVYFAKIIYSNSGIESTKILKIAKVL